MSKKDRLFVPLKSEAFNWFVNGNKRFELRRYQHQYNRRQVRQGRRVELRRGYCGQSFWGAIGSVMVGENLQQLLNVVGFRAVIPDASSIEEAVRKAEEFVGQEGPYILFEVNKEDANL